MSEDLLGAWDVHNQMLFMLFDAIPPEGFQGKPTGMSGRSVGNIFAHVHNIRFYWVEGHAPSMLGGVVKIPTKTKAERESITKEQLHPALVKSGLAVRNMLSFGLEGGKLKNIKPNLMTNYSYFIAHEWYHIGEICMTLTLSGNKLDDKTLYNIWAWGRWTPGGKAPKED